MPLKEENGYLPDLEAIPEDIRQKAKIMFINYPNNPTSAVADKAFYERVVAFAKKYNIIVCSDNAYSEIYFGDDRPCSFLEVPGAKEVGIEFHSLSKTYNMTGWRIGFAVGNAEVIAGLGKIKTNVDSGLFEAIQIAGIEALEGDQTAQEELRNIYKRRRDVLVKGLREAGFKVRAPEATLYVWFPVPNGMTSANFCKELLDKTGVVATPGNGFGQAGEGYARMTICLPEERLIEAVDRLRKAKLV
jgi:LL-diaminopimelate aminotransferase